MYQAFVTKCSNKTEDQMKENILAFIFDKRGRYVISPKQENTNRF